MTHPDPTTPGDNTPTDDASAVDDAQTAYDNRPDTEFDTNGDRVKHDGTEAGDGTEAADNEPVAAHPASGWEVAPLPPGAWLLSPEETIEALITGDHPDAAEGSLALDGALVDALRAGLLLACRLPDGRISFTRPTT